MSSSLVSSGSIGSAASRSAQVSTVSPNCSRTGAAAMNGSDTTTARAEIILITPAVSSAQRTRSVRGVG
jgi:hypothetical protein